MNRFFKCKFIFAAVVLLGLATNAVQAQTTVIYSDSFSGGTVDNPVNLDGSSPQVNVWGSMWTAYVDGTTAANSITTNGTSANVALNVTNAFLPFYPTTGYIYSLSADLSCPDTAPYGARAALGFVSNASTTGDFPFGGTDQAVWFQRGPRNTPGAEDQAYFDGYHMETGDTSAAPPTYTNYQILLDTTATNWAYTFIRNGVTLGTMTSAPKNFAYVGFGPNSDDLTNLPNFTMSVKNFLLTETSVTNFGYTWTGAVAGDPRFSLQNWVDDYFTPAAPNNGGLSHLVFSETSGNGVALTNDFTNLIAADDVLSYKSAILFDSTAPAYTIDGNAITVNGQIVNDSDNDQTINTKILGSGVTIHGASTKSTIFGGGASVSSIHVGGLDSTTGIAVFTGGSEGNPMRYTLTGGPVRIGGDSPDVLNATGTLTLKGYSLMSTSVDDVTDGWGPGGTGTLVMQDNSRVETTNGKAVFVGVHGGHGNLIMSGNSSMNVAVLKVGVWDSDRSRASVGHVEISGNASITSNSNWVEVGQQGEGSIYMDGGSLTVNGGWMRIGADTRTVGGVGGVRSVGSLTMVQTGDVAPTVTTHDFTLVGHNANGTINMSAGTFTCTSMMEIADGNATSSLTMTGNSTLNTFKFNVGNHPGSDGTVDISDGAVFNNTIPRSSTDAYVDEIQIGISGTGVMKVHGGTASVHPVVTNAGSMRVGHKDESNNPAGTGTLEISGYAQFIELSSDMRAVSVATFGATGTMTVADHATYTQQNGNFWLTWGSGGNGTLNLKGGVFESRNIISDDGTATINWQGGTYKIAPTGDDSPFFSWGGGTETFNVGKGANGFGAIVDTSNKSFTMNVNLAHDSTITEGLDGGLTKIGANTLTVNGTLGYDGNTTVNEGTLTVGNINTPLAQVYVATAGTLNASSIVADTLTIGGAPVVIDPVVTAVPEPSTLALLVLAGLAFIGAYIRRK